MNNTPIASALALYDTASSIDRLRFHLRSQCSTPAHPSVGAITGQIGALAGIITGVSTEITRLGSDLFTAPARRAAEAYSCVLPLLGEGMTELGRLHREVIDTRNTALGNERPDEPSARRSAEIVTGCLEAADEVLGEAAVELRAEAAHLTSASAPVQAAARARSPHARVAVPVASAHAVPPASAPMPVVPAAAKGR
ncbi:hypothetical protein ABZ832_12440 [Streptantibioticus parmotrematis]|uniref:hypothetical protein n=1 Tax=Streptantibioticus parmotrematis TaxID=2873249 RepID=UPI0033F56CD1